MKWGESFEPVTPGVVLLGKAPVFQTCLSSFYNMSIIYESFEFRAKLNNSNLRINSNFKFKNIYRINLHIQLFVRKTLLHFNQHNGNAIGITAFALKSKQIVDKT